MLNYQDLLTVASIDLRLAHIAIIQRKREEIRLILLKLYHQDAVQLALNSPLMSAIDTYRETFHSSDLVAYVTGVATSDLSTVSDFYVAILVLDVTIIAGN